MADNGVRVYVWPYGGLGHFGHAAVRLKHASLPGGKCYISWWPGGEGRFATKGQRAVNKVGGVFNAPGIYTSQAIYGRSYMDDRIGELSERSREGLVDGTFKPRTGQEEIDIGFEYGEQLLNEGVPIRYYMDENGNKQRTLFVQNPVKTKVPALGDPGVKVGLDVVKIFKWWQVFSRSPNNWYSLMSRKRNCAGVAALALRAGGAARFAKPPVAFFFMEPNHVQSWVDRINKSLEKLNNSAKTIALAGSDYTGTQTNTEIMTLPEWKTASAEGVSKLAIKSAATKKIDKLIEEYWRLSWGGADNDLFDDKIAKLNEMMDACHEYLATRGGSKRTDAVVTLGNQCLGAIFNHPDPRPTPVTTNS